MPSTQTPEQQWADNFFAAHAADTAWEDPIVRRAAIGTLAALRAKAASADRLRAALERISDSIDFDRLRDKERTVYASREIYDLLRIADQARAALKECPQ